MDDSELEVEKTEEGAGKVEDDGKTEHKGEAEGSSESEKAPSITADISKTSLLPQERYFFANHSFMLSCLSQNRTLGKDN